LVLVHLILLGELLLLRVGHALGQGRLRALRMQARRQELEGVVVSPTCQAPRGSGHPKVAVGRQEHVLRTEAHLVVTVVVGVAVVEKH
ncbi:unnamed protein product, partial [Ixodes pacificus]